MDVDDLSGGADLRHLGAAPGSAATHRRDSAGTPGAATRLLFPYSNRTGTHMVRLPGKMTDQDFRARCKQQCKLKPKDKQDTDPCGCDEQTSSTSGPTSSTSYRALPLQGRQGALAFALPRHRQLR